MPQSIVPAVTPTWIFTPTPSAATSLEIWNTGTSTVFVGDVNVSPYNGFQIAPGNRPTRLQISGQTVYSCSNVVATATGATATSTALPAGSSAFTVSASISTFKAGTVVLLGAGNAKEVLTISATGGATTTTFTLSTATLYDHVASSPVTVATALPGSIKVTAGVL